MPGVKEGVCLGGVKGGKAGCFRREHDDVVLSVR